MVEPRRRGMVTATAARSVRVGPIRRIVHAGLSYAPPDFAQISRASSG